MAPETNLGISVKYYYHRTYPSNLLMSEKSAKSSPFVERFEKLAKSSPFVERGAETVVAVGQSDAPVVVVVVELTLNVSKLAVHSKHNICYSITFFLDRWPFWV